MINVGCKLTGRLSEKRERIEEASGVSEGEGEEEELCDGIILGGSEEEEEGVVGEERAEEGESV